MAPGRPLGRPRSWPGGRPGGPVGPATLSRHGVEHMRRIGRKGFSALTRRFGRDRHAALMALNAAGSIQARFIARDGDPDNRLAHAMYASFGLEPDDGPPLETFVPPA